MKYICLIFNILFLIKIQSIEKIYISAVGDIMAHIDLQESAINHPDGFNYLFKNIKKYFDKKDIVIANLETPVSDRIPISGYPQFSTNSNYIKAIKNSNINFLSTANNHAFDKYKEGVISTINILNENDMDFAGTGYSKKDSDNFVFRKINGITLAIYSLTFSLNGLLNNIEENSDFYINFYPLNDKNKFSTLLEKIKNVKKIVDKVIILYHIGDEYSKTPNSFQIENFNLLLQSGTDIIIGCHPHVLQDLKFETFLDKKVLYIYSIGNFISAQTRYNLIKDYYNDYSNVEIRTSESIILNINLIKFNKKVEIVNPTYIPIFNIVDKNKNGNTFNLYSFKDIENNNIKDIQKDYLEKIKKIIKIRRYEIKKIINIREEK